MTATHTDVDLDARVAWLLRRRTGIGGSDVAGILGLSPWESPTSVWADKVGLLPLDTTSTSAQEFGKRAEPMLREWFEDRTGLTVTGEQAEHHDPDRPWMRVTLDGEIPSVRAVAEWKATSDPPWTDPPIMYQCQAAWAMAITGARRCCFGVLHIAFGRPEFRTYMYERDDHEIRYVVERCHTFWHDHVLTGTPPDVDGHPATTAALSTIYNDTTETAVEADEPLRDTIGEILTATARIQHLEEQVTELKNRVRAALGTATVLADGTDRKGRPKVLATWRTQSRFAPGLDLDRLAATYPAWTGPDGHRDPRPVRVLLIKNPKPTKGTTT